VESRATPPPIAFRALQGAGGAAVLTNTTALLVDSFKGRSLTAALGYNVAVAPATQTAGPVAGGAIVAGFGWRAIFLANVPIGVVGAALAFVTIKPDRLAKTCEGFDLAGCLLSFAMLGLGLLYISQGTSGDGCRRHA
jgi:MFS family permease